MMKKIGDITVNDGKGFLDNEGLCDSLLVDLNRLPKILIDGQYIQFCLLVASMGQRLINLKKGIASDMKSMKDKVDELKKMNDSLVEQITGLPVEKEDSDDGENRNMV